VLAFDTPLLLTCAGFLVLIAVQALIYGNASALAAGEVPQVAGTASRRPRRHPGRRHGHLSPDRQPGAATTAVPMIAVMMVTGIVGSLAYLLRARPTPSAVTATA